MNTPDAFGDLARYYDPLMSHVNYDRWYTTTQALGEMLASPVRHLDAACGTGTLATMLRQTGWDSMGIDLSRAMLHEGRKKTADLPVAVADLRALPFHNQFDLVTCLFDSLNFLLEEEGLAAAFRQFHTALRAGGILYVDIITERMVTDHFEGKTWDEQNDGFRSRWSSSYDKKQAVAESLVQVNTGRVSSIRERIFELPRVTALLEQAGFEILGTFDADNWKTPRKKTTRVDIVAVKPGGTELDRRFQKAVNQVRALVYGR